MRKNCETCKHDRLKTPVCDECYNTSDAPTKWEPAGHYKPDTNADRIRAMSDDELAELFGGIVDDGKSCSLICGDLNKCKRNNSIERICKNHYLKWLKQPAEGE